MTPVTLKTSDYFPSGFRISGFVFCFIGPLLAAVNIWVGGTVFLVGLLIVTSHYGVHIDPNSKTYFDYTSVLWYKSGNKMPYDAIEYVFINSGIVSTTMNSRVSSTTIREITYNGYLRFQNGKKVFLGSDTQLSAVEQRMKVIATALQCPFVDHTKS